MVDGGRVLKDQNGNDGRPNEVSARPWGSNRRFVSPSTGRNSRSRQNKPHGEGFDPFILVCMCVFVWEREPDAVLTSDSNVM